MIALSIAMRGYLLSRSWFWQDDFAIASRARSAQLNADWLLQDYLGHLMPLNFLQAWVLNRVAPMSWPVTSAITLAWSLAFAFVFWILARRLVRSGAAALAATAVAVSCPLWSTSVSWFASAVQSLPSLTLVTVAALNVLSYLERGRPRSLVWFALAYACGLLWWEKAGLGVVLFALVAAAMVLREGAPRELLVRVAHVGAIWLALSALYVWAFLALVGLPEADPGAGGIPHLAYEVILSVVPTGLVGGPWQQNSDGHTLQPLVNQPWLLWVWAVLIAMALVGWRRHRAALLLAAGAVVAMLILDVTLVALSRIGYLGPVIGRDTRYTVDVVPVAALGLALAVAGGRRDRPRLGVAARDTFKRLVPWAAAMYLVVAWPSIFYVAEARATIGARQWTEQALAEAATDADRVLASTAVPDRIVSPTFGVDARSSHVLGSFGVSPDRFDQPATQWWRFADEGALVPASIWVLTGRSLDGDPGCGVPVRGTPVTLSVPEADELAATQVDVVRFAYYSARDLTTVVESADHVWEVDLTAGLGHVYLPGAELSATVRFGGLSPDEAFCLTTVERGIVT